MMMHLHWEFSCGKLPSESFISRNGGATMNFMGIDQHKQYSHMTLMDKEGGVLKSERVYHTREEIRRFLDGIDGKVRAVVEASRTSYVMADLLESMDIEVKMANPMQVKAIAHAKIKTDKRDSKVLADLLRTNLIPEVYMRSRENREAQRLLRQRIQFVRMRTQIKNRIRWLLAQHEEDVFEEVEKVRDLFSVGGLRFLSRVSLSSETDRKLLDELITTYKHLVERIKASDSLVEKLSREIRDAQLICTVPGFGQFLSVLVATEIGNIHRFSTPSKLHAYVGVIPSTHSSGGKTYHGKMIKSGNRWMRWAVVEAVWPAIRADFKLRVFYDRHARRKGANKARIIVARRLLTIIYKILKEQRSFEWYRMNKSVAFYKS
jgi:transposase